MRSGVTSHSTRGIVKQRVESFEGAGLYRKITARTLEKKLPPAPILLDASILCSVLKFFGR